MKLSNRPIAKGFFVTLMSPLGRYPAESFLSESASLIVSPELCFSIVRVKREDWGFSEVDSLAPLIIPLMGSIVLGGKAGDPYLYPYPTHRSLDLETENEESLDAECIGECKRFLLTCLTDNRYLSSAADKIHQPPALGGMPYDLVCTQFCDTERKDLIHKLEGGDPLVLRGVGSLIKANMAWQHPEFGEAACLFLWISLDAAYALVLRRLRQSGMENPGARDAARYFESISGYGTDWDKFFEDDYDNRIRVVHPDNRFGPEARVQLLADDFLELRDMLVPLFEFLITDVTSEPRSD